MSDELKPLMRRVYVDYTNRVGPRVNLTNQEIRVLQAANWFDLLKIPKVRYHVRAHTPFEPKPRAEVPLQNPCQAFDIVRLHANDRLEQLPTQWGPMRLVGVTWKRSNEAMVNGHQGFHTVRNDAVTPIKNAEAHLKANEARSQTVVFAQHTADLKPFPIDEFKGVGLLHLMMQLPELRVWLWGQPLAPLTISARPVVKKGPQPPDLSQWLADHAEASSLWAGHLPDTRGNLAQAVEAVRSQRTLPELVRVFNQHIEQFPPNEAAVFRRATDIELRRRELRDLAGTFKQTLAEAQTPAKRYRTLLLCHRQVCQRFVDLDWEADGDLRDFTRQIEASLNDPQFVKQWQPVPLVDMQDAYLANSLTRALHIVNTQRTAPLKIRWPVPHEVFKTWVALQREYGPADDFPRPSDFGLQLSADQRQLRARVWSQFDDLAAIDTQSPQARYEITRLSPALHTLHKFKQGLYSREQVLDAVRRCPRMRLLLDDILRATA